MEDSDGTLSMLVAMGAEETLAEPLATQQPETLTTTQLDSEAKSSQPGSAFDETQDLDAAEAMCELDMLQQAEDLKHIEDAALVASSWLVQLEDHKYLMPVRNDIDKFLMEAALTTSMHHDKHSVKEVARKCQELLMQFQDMKKFVCRFTYPAPEEGIDTPKAKKRKTEF